MSRDARGVSRLLSPMNCPECQKKQQTIDEQRQLIERYRQQAEAMSRSVDEMRLKYAPGRVVEFTDYTTGRATGLSRVK